LFFPGRTADVTNSTKITFRSEQQSNNVVLNDFGFKTCKTWHRKLFIS